MFFFGKTIEWMVDKRTPRVYVVDIDRSLCPSRRSIPTPRGVHDGLATTRFSHCCTDVREQLRFPFLGVLLAHLDVIRIGCGETIGAYNYDVLFWDGSSFHTGCAAHYFPGSEKDIYPTSFTGRQRKIMDSKLEVNKAYLDVARRLVKG